MNLRDQYIKRANQFNEKQEQNYTDEDIKEEAIFVLNEAINYIKGHGEQPITNKAEVVNLILNALSRLPM